jgi:2'-5' RNA ligase
MGNKKEVKAHDYKEIYEMLGYNLSNLGCLMLDTEPINISYALGMDDGTGIISPSFPAYYAKNKERFWIDGYVADKTPHLTLFYGFLQEAGCFKTHIEKLLKDTNISTVKISEVSFFDSPYEDEPYYCIVAKIEKTDDLIEAHNKMTLLPNIQTFPDYKPHITIAYIVKDETIRDNFIEYLKKELLGKELKVIGLNYGGNK